VGGFGSGRGGVERWLDDVKRALLGKGVIPPSTALTKKERRKEEDNLAQGT